MSEQPITAGLRVERDGPVTTVVLDRPERLNPLSYEVIRGLRALLEELRRDTAQRVVLLTGSGRAFSAGIDLKEQASGALWDDGVGPVQERYALQQAVGDLVAGLRRIPQPVVAVVAGVAAGGGMSLACAADVRIAEPAATFSAAFVRLGASGGDLGSSYFLPRLIGWDRAAEMLYTGRTVDAQEALRLGLVTELTGPGEGIARARELAARMLAVAPMSTRMTKSLLDLSRDGASLAQMLEYENRTQILLSRTEDFARGRPRSRSAERPGSATGDAPDRRGRSTR
ncbi:MAG: enoyl-CoA hydratase-related protein [Pseudonocardia sp.]|nr:enoyl-CoA hydratase-related protein [Pseudonocardia sp.]